MFIAKPLKGFVNHTRRAFVLEKQDNASFSLVPNPDKSTENVSKERGHLIYE